MTFANEEAAKADPVVGSYFANGEWKSDICVPGVFVWAPASNTIGTDPNGNSYVVRRAYDANWRVIIAKAAPDASLLSLPSCHLVADREAAAAGRPFILQSILGEAQLAELALEPMFAGSSYPFGK
ncbi:MAG: hypothetical protein WAM77_01315 [Xanthobacteraceae bacterium]